MPPNKPEVEALIFNESSMSDYCRFAQTVLCMPPVEGFDVDFDVGLDELMIAHLMGHKSDLFYMQMVCYGTKL